MQNINNCSIRTITDHSGDAVSYGAYIDYDGKPIDFSYCGPYTGLIKALAGLRDGGAEIVHRVETLPSVGGWLVHEVAQEQGSGFTLSNVWGNVIATGVEA